jgi:hypothetical protein
MAAPDGNTNASKWTLQATLQTLEKIEYHAEDDRIYTLRKALLLSGVYQGVWSYWKKKWADNEEVMEKICFIDELFIDKLMDGAITKRLHFGACMFALRVNHGISDKPLKDGEKEREEKLPVHLKKQLALDIEASEVPPPLVSIYSVTPKMYSNVPPAEGWYRKVDRHVYSTYTEEECSAAYQKVKAHRKIHGFQEGWVLPEEEYVREKMRVAA